MVVSAKWPSPKEIQQLHNKGINISAGTCACVQFQLALSGCMGYSSWFQIIPYGQRETVYQSAGSAAERECVCVSREYRLGVIFNRCC